MFADRARIIIKSGKGGDGHVSFRREKYVPDGGPNGGDGGKGGDVIFVVDKGLNTLYEFRHKHKFCAQNGEQGGKQNMSGKNGEDLIIKVPEGTTSREEETGKAVADMSGDNQRAVVLKGGKGGKGNQHYATPTMQVPKYAQPGQKSQELNVTLELKSIADVGLVGFPNVGKSTILSRVTKATPKIADYHFTTLSPNLGVCKTIDNRSFVIADLPGLIEGASEGLGLGDKFLRHIERCKVIVHIIDMGSTEGRDPYDDFVTINKELENFNAKLIKKPMIVIANKMDLPEAKDNLEELKKKVDCEIMEVSAAMNKGLQQVVDRLADILDTIPTNPLYDESQIESNVLYKFKKEEPFTITKEDDCWVISGDEIERIFKMTKFSSDEAAYRFAKKLKRMGIDDKLRELGAEENDQVRILNFYFNYKD